MSKLLKVFMPRHHYSGRHTVSARYGFASPAADNMIVLLSSSSNF